MVDAFRASLRDASDAVELREWTLPEASEDQTARFSTKVALVLRALAEQPPGAVVVIADVDVRFFKPVAARAGIDDLERRQN